MEEMFDEMSHAEVAFGGQLICLFVGLAIDGWLGVVYYPATKESISLFQTREIEDAKRNVEGWVRITHSVSDAIEWTSGPPPNSCLP